MRTFITFTLTVSFLVAFGQTGKLTGHLIVKNKADIKNVIDAMVMLKVDNYQRIAVIDKNLNFSFDSLKTDTTILNIPASSHFRDTIISNIVTKDKETVHLEIQYPPFCIYTKSKNNKTCPVCNKQDSVIPIIYGLVINTGKKTKKKQQEFKSGGCQISGCDPHWYCKRDDKEF